MQWPSGAGNPIRESGAGPRFGCPVQVRANFFALSATWPQLGAPDRPLELRERALDSRRRPFDSRGRSLDSRRRPFAPIQPDSKQFEPKQNQFKNNMQTNARQSAPIPSVIMFITIIQIIRSTRNRFVIGAYELV